MLTHILPVSAVVLSCFSVAVKEPVAGPSACQQIRQLLKEALQILQDEGIVYRKVKSQDEVYHVRNGREILNESLHRQ